LGAVLETLELTKIYKTSGKGTLAVNKLNLSVQEGEIFGLVGPNGSGKTTTLKIILGLLHPTSGQAKLFGEDARTAMAARERVGFLPEGPYFYDHLRGEEVLGFYADLFGLDGKAKEKRIDQLLERVGMEAARKRVLKEYSRGMVQRIGLAQALLNEPDLVLLDEPTSGLDPIGARDIRELILGLRTEGKTVFLCSHLLDEVQRLCDRVAILHRGNLLEVIETRSLKEPLEEVFVRLVEAQG